MNKSNDTKASTLTNILPKETLETAARFVARAQIYPENEAFQKELNDWLAQSSDNALAYADVIATWQCEALIETLSDYELDESFDRKNVVPITSRLQMNWKQIGTIAAMFAFCMLGLSLFIKYIPMSQSGSGIELAAQYSTARGEIREFTFPDGTTVFLNGMSKIEVSYSEKERLFKQISGEVYYDVAKEPNRPLRVVTDSASFTALGTEFNVDRWSSGVTLEVTEGRVGMISSINNWQEVYEIGNAVTLSNSLHKQVRSFSTTQQDDWRNGWIVADQMSLTQLLDKVSRSSAKPIVLDSTRYSAKHIDGRFNLSQLDDIIGMVADLYGLEIVEMSDKIILRENAL